MSLKYLRKTTASANASQSAATPSIAVPRESTQRTTKDSALQQFVTQFLHPIALLVHPTALDSRRARRMCPPLLQPARSVAGKSCFPAKAAAKRANRPNAGTRRRPVNG